MNILLAVSGSISAYKAYELLRSYIKDNYEVRIVLTKGALEFVRPEVFTYLGAQEVYLAQDDFNPKKKFNGTVLHIDLVKWMDRLVLAPATANTIAKMAAGVSDDLLTSIFLANTKKPCFIFPAMNTQMLENPITQRNLSVLSQIEYIYIGKTGLGELACKDVGAGKLLSIETIFEETTLNNLKELKKTILVTTGATLAPLDPVRYLTNPASGKTGIHIAKEFLKKNYKVILICGHSMKEKVQHLNTIPHLEIIHAQTTQQMYQAAKENFSKADVYISSAAISDIEFTTQDSKIKKNELSKSLDFTQSIDILKELSSTKDKQYIIGFAAESSLQEKKLLDKMNSKNMDLLIANVVNSGHQGKRQGFGEDQNNYSICNHEHCVANKIMSKKELAQFLVNKVESL